MILIDPITNGEVETFTDEATERLTKQGYKPKSEEKPKPKRTSTRKQSTKKGQ